MDLGDKFLERELEQNFIENLKTFLLELGKGSAYVGRQYRITLNNEHFHVDIGILPSLSEMLCFDRLKNQ